MSDIGMLKQLDIHRVRRSYNFEMPRRLKDAGLILGMGAALVFAKHKIARLSVVLPFNQDPCDAVWAFAFTTVSLIAVVAVARAFRSSWNGPASAHFNLRSQQALALAVFTTFLADAIVLGKHPSTWIEAVSRNQLLIWLGMLAAVAAATQLVILFNQRTLVAGVSTRWKRRGLAFAAAIPLLAFCPEWPNDPRKQHISLLSLWVHSSSCCQCASYFLFSCRMRWTGSTFGLSVQLPSGVHCC